MTRVIIYGGRDYSDEAYAFARLDALHIVFGFTAVIEGGARGADRIGRRWAESRGVPVETYAADWGNLDAPGASIKVGANGPYNARAGFDRNRDMANAKLDLGVQFPGGRGTEHMRGLLNQRQIEVIEA